MLFGGGRISIEPRPPPPLLPFVGVPPQLLPALLSLFTALLALCFFVLVGVPVEPAGEPPAPVDPDAARPPPNGASVGLRHSGEPNSVAAVGELISLESIDFFFVPKLSEDSERGKRDRKAGVVEEVVPLFGGCGCGNSGGELIDEGLNAGYEPGCGGKEREVVVVAWQ
uniref:Uncharacterized protein n=1 Tax=Anopheles farauti TaxID=69004 RepID=A0A182QVA1_9DIPT